jgi:hypothetical protein
MVALEFTILNEPAQRQSRELFQKVETVLVLLEAAEVLTSDNRFSLALRNGSRTMTLPGDPRAVRALFTSVDG